MIANHAITQGVCVLAFCAGGASSFQPVWLQTEPDLWTTPKLRPVTLPLLDAYGSGAFALSERDDHVERSGPTYLDPIIGADGVSSRWYEPSHLLGIASVGESARDLLPKTTVLGFIGESTRAPFTASKLLD